MILEIENEANKVEWISEFDARVLIVNKYNDRSLAGPFIRVNKWEVLEPLSAITGFKLDSLNLHPALPS